jgi:hypothetical protein
MGTKRYWCYPIKLDDMEDEKFLQIFVGRRYILNGCERADWIHLVQAII